MDVHNAKIKDSVITNEGQATVVSERAINPSELGSSMATGSWGISLPSPEWGVMSYVMP